MAINEIIEHSRNYEKVLGWFNQMTDNIIAASSRNEEIPTISFPSEDRSLLEIKVAGARVMCKLRYTGDGSILRYGYVANYKSGKFTFHETKRLFFDRLGNNLTEKDGKSAGFSMQNDDDLHSIYYPHILNALEMAWAHFEKD